METAIHPSREADQDQRLLEGLFQLALNGQEDSRDFAMIDREVYARLLDAYTERH